MQHSTLKPVFGHPRYKVNRDGSIVVGKYGVRRPWNSYTGYKMSSVFYNGKATAIPVHRMVALAFIGPPPFPGATVDHIDSNRTNNDYTNLRWLSLSDNVSAYARRVYAKVTVKDVVKIRRRAANGESYSSMAIEYGVSTNSIRQIVTGHTYKDIPGADDTPRVTITTPAVALEICRLHDAGMSETKISAMTGRSRCAVHHAIKQRASSSC